MQLLSVLLTASAAALVAGSPALRARDVRAIEARQKGPQYPANTFDQLIDHFPNSTRYVPHAKGTFKQRYFYDSTYYKPGGPVFMQIGGETSAEYWFDDVQTGIIQILMQQFGGLGIVIENRYYGQSVPFNTTTTDQLAYLTTEQTIADNSYFAQHVKIPGFNSSLNAPNTPWIVYGGSLAGAQSAFTMKAHGDVIYGGIASSGVIIPKVEYPGWYKPIQLYAPGDCVASINNIIDKFDSLVSNNQKDAIQQFKEIFGLGGLKDVRDFAQVIAWPIGGPFNYLANSWQELNWNSTFGSGDFWDFCRNVTDVNPSKTSLAIDQQLANYTNGEPWTNLGNYAGYIKRVINPECPSGDYSSTSCFGTQNQSFWANTANQDGRSYLYQVCTEQGSFQVAPQSGPSLISRVLKADYMQQWCNWAFPKGKYNAIPSAPQPKYYEAYGGANISVDRCAFIDGASDVWRDLCYHSTEAPSPRPYSDLQPQHLIEGAGHVWDRRGIGNVAAEPQYIREAHYWEIRVVTRWLRDFQSWRKAQHGY